MLKLIAIGLMFAAAALPVAVSAATTPLQTVETHVDQLVSILRDDSSAASEKKNAIRSISDSLFDFFELSRLTLGREWRNFNSEQQKQFVTLYRQLLEGIYLDRLLQYKDEKVNYEQETALSEKRSEVQTQVVTDTGNIIINYKLVQKGDQWKVYDLVIENVSLARNYRGQFASILSKSTPQELLDTLREKVEELQGTEK